MHVFLFFFFVVFVLLLPVLLFLPWFTSIFLVEGILREDVRLLKILFNNLKNLMGRIHSTVL